MACVTIMLKIAVFHSYLSLIFLKNLTDYLILKHIDMKISYCLFLMK